MLRLRSGGLCNPAKLIPSIVTDDYQGNQLKQNFYSLIFYREVIKIRGNQGMPNPFRDNLGKWTIINTKSGAFHGKIESVDKRGVTVLLPADYTVNDPSVQLVEENVSVEAEDLFAAQTFFRRRRRRFFFRRFFFPFSFFLFPIFF